MKIGSNLQKDPRTAKLDRVQVLAEHLMRELGEQELGTPLQDLGWRFRYDNAKKRLGRCFYFKKLITLSTNLVLLNDSDNWQIDDTIRHEIAHAIDFEERGTSDTDLGGRVLPVELVPVRTVWQTRRISNVPHSIMRGRVPIVDTRPVGIVFRDERRHVPSAVISTTGVGTRMTSSSLSLRQRPENPYCSDMRQNVCTGRNGGRYMGRWVTT
jgi:hypothetical protein